MYNGFDSRLHILPLPVFSEVTNSDQAADSYEYRMFSLKDIIPEPSHSSQSLNPSSCSSSKNHPKTLPRKRHEDTSTTFTNMQSRKATEEVFSSVGTSITEFRLATMNSPEANKCIDIVMGNSPCAAYCGRCKNYVHTLVDFQEGLLPRFLIKFSREVTMCCGHPEWINKLIVHKCPNCRIILGKF